VPHGVHGTIQTAFRIPERLLALAKGEARRQDITLTAWVLDAMERKLNAAPAANQTEPEPEHCPHPTAGVEGDYCTTCKQDID
jgi:hypothetical protein